MMKKKLWVRKLGIVLLSAVLLSSLLLLSSCKDDGVDSDFQSTVKKSDSVTNYVCLRVQYTDAVTSKLTTGEILIELDPENAPITVKNFQDLVADGFYNGLTFHRIIENFMIQGGDPKGNGTGGSENTIKGEFSANGVNNTISHKRGVISMARNAISYDSASSQFFIVHGTNVSSSLDGQYAAFGQVLSGMDVVDAIAKQKANANDAPLNKVTIVSAYFAEKPE